MQKDHSEDDVNLKDFFVPLTTTKAVFFIFIIGFVVYFSSLFNGFVGDDHSLITENVFIRSITNIPYFFTGNTFYNNGSGQAGVYYKPLLLTTFSIIYNFLGSSPAIFHLVQLIFHIANSILVLLFFGSIFKKGLAFVFALVFLTHPIISEAVLYVAAMQEPLFLFFGLLSVWILTRPYNAIRLTLVCLCLLLSLLSKETGILCIFISVLYAFVFNKKYFPLLFGYTISLVVLYLVVRVNTVGLITKSLSAPISQVDLPERLINAPSIFYFFIEKFIFPLNLSSSYQWVYRQVSVKYFFTPLILDLLFVSAIVTTMYIFHKKKMSKYFKYFAFFGVWFLVGVLLHLQIFPLDVTVAERWFYFPIIGLLGMSGILMEVVYPRLRSKWWIVVTVIVLLSMTSRTFIRSFDWRDGLTLATHDIKVSPQSYDLENVIGEGLMRQGRLDEARLHMEKSIELYPYLTNYNNLGLIYLKLGDYQKSKDAYNKALTYGDYYLVYENIAGLGLVYGEPQENVTFILGALRKFPQNAQLWKYLAIIQYNHGKIDNAKLAISKAYQYNSKDPSIVYIHRAIEDNESLNLDFTVGRN